MALARELTRAWTARTLRARYQQSLMGWLWAIVQPAANAAIITVVFSTFIRVDTGDTPYILFSYVAMVAWTFLASAVPDMADSIVQNMALVTKIYFPREVLPISAMLARLLDLAVAAVPMAVLLVVFGTAIEPFPLLFLPIILAIQVALVLGLGLACAAMNVFYRDVQPMLRLVIQVWFYASPIVYPISFVPAGMRDWYYLNPVAGIIEAYRAVLLNASAPSPSLVLSGAVALSVLAVGYWLFKRVEYQFADII